MKTHLLTLNWNKCNTIKNLKETLIPNLENLDWHWYIKDNGSVDGSIEEINSWNNARIHLIKCAHNRDNYSQGMNILFREANPNDDDAVITLNNDIIFNGTTSINNMIDLLRHDKNIGLVGAKLNYKETDKIQHCGVLFHKINGLPYHYRANIKEEMRDRQNRMFPIITGALALTRGDIFRELMFNEKFHWCFEDCDFAMKVSFLLKKIVVCCGKTNVFHEESASLKNNPVHKMFFKHNCKLFLETWYKNINIYLDEKYNNPNHNLYINGSKQ